MQKFRHKPFEFEAFQWFPGDERPGIMWYALATKIICDDPFTLGEVTKKQYYVTTKQDQPINIEPGDWLIVQSDDRYRPCKPEIFVERFESADTNPQSISTVKTTWGEFTIDADKAAEAVGAFLSHYRRSCAGGYTPDTGWFEKNIRTLSADCVIKSVADINGGGFRG